MTISKKFRNKAWNSLKGKYGMGLAVILLESVIISTAAFFAGTASNPLFQSMPSGITASCSVIGLLLTIFITNPVYAGVKNYFVNAANGTGEIGDMFSQFKAGFTNTVKTMLLLYVKTFLWLLLLIVPGIIKSYEYAMIPYILGANPEITLKEAFEKSKKMMEGNKWRFFKLQFSFIGWALLCILTLGIGFIFLSPYQEAAYAEFYLEVKGNIA